MRIVAHLPVVVTMACLSVLARADVTVVEYHHACFDHYFVTPVPELSTAS